MKIAKQVTTIDDKKTNIEVDIKFTVQVFESRKWHNKYLEADAPDEIKEKKQHRIFVVRIIREEV